MKISETLIDAITAALIRPEFVKSCVKNPADAAHMKTPEYNTFIKRSAQLAR